jgi:hypothetical protein
MKAFTLNGKVEPGITLQQEIYGQEKPELITSFDLDRVARNKIVKMVPIKAEKLAHDGAMVTKEIGQRAVIFQAGVVQFPDGLVVLTEENPEAEVFDRVLVKLEAKSKLRGFVDTFSSSGAVDVQKASNFPGDHRHHTEESFLVAVLQPGQEVFAYYEDSPDQPVLVRVKYLGDEEFKVTLNPITWDDLPERVGTHL